MPTTNEKSVLSRNMREGYDSQELRNPAAACAAWEKVWSLVKSTIESENIHSINDLDTRFGNEYFISNWIQDYEAELWNAGLKDRAYLRKRIDFCTQLLERFCKSKDLLSENLQRALAETYFELGESGKSDQLFEQWLSADPQWGWGWIGWSDCYFFATDERRDLQRAENILLEALAVTNLRDRDDVLDRLANMLEDSGREEESQKYRKQITNQFPGVTWSTDFFGADLIAGREFEQTMKTLVNPPQKLKGDTGPNIGRKDPCPCGSGKKYKRCCGAGR